jgi:hypothetical protein
MADPGNPFREPLLPLVKALMKLIPKLTELRARAQACTFPGFDAMPTEEQWGSFEESFRRLFPSLHPALSQLVDETLLEVNLYVTINRVATGRAGVEELKAATRAMGVPDPQDPTVPPAVVSYLRGEGSGEDLDFGPETAGPAHDDEEEGGHGAA